MNFLIKITLFILLAGYANSFFCQVSPVSRKTEDAVLTKTKLAEDVILKYTDYSNFTNGMNQQAIDSFKLLFEPSAELIFDAPYKNIPVKNDDYLRIGKDNRQQSEIINVFGKSVSLDLYLDILKRKSEEFPATNFDSTIFITGRKDSIGKNKDTLVIEIERKFRNTAWCVESKVKYLFYLRKTAYNMNIFKVIVNDENTSETSISMTMINASAKTTDEDYFLPGIAAGLRIQFRLPINDYSVNDTTNSEGEIQLENAANKNSLVFLDTVIGLNGVQYEIPPDWKGTGRKVSEQPEDGFTILLRPYRWNGFAYSLAVSGGSFSPQNLNLVNFQRGSSFNIIPGYGAGIGFSFTYFFNSSKWRTNPQKWIFGIGSGISADYLICNTESKDFSQNKYNYLDFENDECQVLFSGKSFSEKSELYSAGLPLFVEFKTRMGKKSAFAIQAGAKFSFPISSSYKATGSFSRWGYYEDLNSQPITNDEFYNYFTDSTIIFTGDIVYNLPQVEALVKLKGYFNVFKNKADNSLEIGLIFSVPLTSSTNYSYPKSPVQNYSGYWIDTENNMYHSVAYSRNKIYSYFFGVSIGFNFINYKLQ